MMIEKGGRTTPMTKREMQLLASLKLALRDLKESDKYECRYCLFHQTPRPCDGHPLDYDCSDCPFDCGCKDCRDSSHWTWRGINEDIGTDRLVQLPCMPGDDLYWIDTEEEEPTVLCEKGGVLAVCVYKDGVKIISKGSDIPEPLHERYTHLTREEAEAALPMYRRYKENDED